jgi:hypothetical protein
MFLLPMEYTCSTMHPTDMPRTAPQHIRDGKKQVLRQLHSLDCCCLGCNSPEQSRHADSRPAEKDLPLLPRAVSKSTACCICTFSSSRASCLNGGCSCCCLGGAHCKAHDIGKRRSSFLVTVRPKCITKRHCRS